MGRALVLALADAGCDVYIHYNTSAGPAEETAAAARERGVQAAVGQADLADPAGAAEAVAAAGEQLGPVQVLVNSASGFPEDTLADLTLEGWNRTLAVTLTAPMLATQAVAAALPDDTVGAIVNITDWRTARPYPDHFSYSVAKAGLDGLTRASAVALAPRIRVNGIALGAILPPPGKGSDYLKELASSIPLQRAGGTDVVADTLLYLLGNEFVTGEIIRVSGGAHLT